MNTAPLPAADQRLSQAPPPKRPPRVLPKPNETCWCGSGDKYKRCHKEDDAAYLRNEKHWLDTNKVVPGVISPRRTVPGHIRLPPYALTGDPGRPPARFVCTPEEIVRMRRACQAAAKILRQVGEKVAVGVPTDELDAFVHELTIEMGGYPSPLNYHGFPKSLCTSVNEVICHGIPDSRKLKDGDIVNLDVTIYLDGVHGDCNATFAVGSVDEESKQLMQVTRECLELGIAAVKPGRPVSDIGRAIEQHATAQHFGVVRAYCGHGIGELFHSSLQIPHYFDPKMTTKMEVGMTFTIEPMITVGTYDYFTWADDWTVVTKDLKRSAQYEHTVLVTETGGEVLTVEAPG